MLSSTLLLTATAALASAQVVFNPTTGSFVCPATGGNFCPGPSLMTNIIIRCTGTVGQPGNCNDNLADVPPAGLKLNARCYQSSAAAGDANCSLDGIVYPESGIPFPIPSKTNVTGTVTKAVNSPPASLTIAPTSNNLSIAPSAVTSTDYIRASALASPLAAMATLGVPYPIPAVSNNGTGIGGVVLGSGTGTNQIPKPTSTYIAGAGTLDVAMLIVGGGVAAAALLL